LFRVHLAGQFFPRWSSIRPRPRFQHPRGGRSTGGTLRGKEKATPLVDDGFMYVTDSWSRVMKFDVRSGTAAIPLWRHDPKVRVSRTSCGLAMYGNKVFLSTNDARMELRDDGTKLLKRKGKRVSS
jgi:hypothetical protein